MPTASGPHNIQYNNVGNTGDILKHAALVELARLIQQRNLDVQINYLDTHAFVAEAPLANACWHDEVKRLANSHPAYETYYSLERQCVERGNYSCSTGLGAMLLTDARFYLCERDAQTRAALQAQFTRRQCNLVRLLDDVACWDRDIGKVSAGPLLALVDPFALTDGDWDAARSAVARLWAPGADGLLEVFSYNRECTGVTWPRAPSSWAGPIAQIGRALYFLALYAAGDIVAGAAERLATLGWSSG